MGGLATGLLASIELVKSLLIENVLDDEALHLTTTPVQWHVVSQWAEVVGVAIAVLVAITAIDIIQEATPKATRRIRGALIFAAIYEVLLSLSFVFVGHQLNEHNAELEIGWMLLKVFVLFLLANLATPSGAVAMTGDDPHPARDVLS